MIVDWLVPVAAMGMIFGLGWLITNVIMTRMRAQAEPDGAYRALAEEAIKSQEALLAEARRMNATLQDVERLLREV